MVHPPLEVAPDECQDIVRAFESCHEKHFFKKYVGACNPEELKLVKCFKNHKKEKIDKETRRIRKHNAEIQKFQKEIRRRETLVKQAELDIRKELAIERQKELESKKTESGKSFWFF